MSGWDLFFSFLFSLFRKNNHFPLEKDLNPFRNDENASFLSLFTEKNFCEVEIYTKPKPYTSEFTYMEKLREKNKGQRSVEDVD